MTEPRHFHSARKGSGSLRPFPIYPLYTQAEILSLDKPIADCFLFRPRKNRKSAGNAVIPTYPTHCSHGLQYLRYKRPMFAFMRESGYTLGSRRKIAHSGSHGETGAFRTGPLSLPSTRCCTFTNIPGPGVRTAYFAVLCTGGVCGKEAESLLDIDARTVRRCPEATRSRRNAQPRCWFLRCIGELHGLPSLHPRAERKICCWGCLVFACGVGNSSLVGTK